MDETEGLIPRWKYVVSSIKDFAENAFTNADLNDSKKSFWVFENVSGKEIVVGVELN